MKRHMPYLLAAILCVAGCSSVALPPAASQGSSPAAATMVTASVRASTGGEVRTAEGAELIVPPHVLESDAIAVIQPQPDGVVDMHLSAKWSGTVQVGLPVDAGSAPDDLLVHQV